MAEAENEQEELEVSQVEELEDQQPMMLQDTIKFDDDFTEVVDTDTSPDKAKKEPGSASEPTPSTLISDGSSWAILEIIKTVIQIAFNNWLFTTYINVLINWYIVPYHINSFPLKK